MLRYEDLKQDPHTALRKILEFLDIYDYTDEQIDRAVELSSFENMKKAERNRESSSPWLNPGRRPVAKAMKVRKGKVGGYRDEMTDEDIEYVNHVINTYLTDELAEYKSA
jgi:hypothetical protein